MSMAKIIEITADSTESFEAAIRTGIDKASKSVEHVDMNLEGAWVQQHKVAIQDGNITAFRVDMKLTFVSE